MTARFLPIVLLAVTTVALADDAIDADAPLAEITVTAKRVAIDRPAATFATPATVLRFDPLTELQSRGLAEGQSDVTVRGGLFENTGFKVGAVNVVDPQTGHYVAELPVDPAATREPAITKGVDNALEGFNAAVATIAYDFAPIESGGTLLAGVGSDSLNFQSLRAGVAADGLGIAASIARSDGDGSVVNGDHEFLRANLHLQQADERAQTDVLLAWQDKFYGWPGAYTGFATLAETDDTQTSLLLANHRREHDNGYIEVGGFYRRLVDDYDFDRTTVDAGGPGSFEHETRVLGLGIQGVTSVGRIDWRYSGQFTADELVRSTDLVAGDFNKRRYLTLAVVPSVEFGLGGDDRLRLRAGLKYDSSNRDDEELLPQFALAWTRAGADARTEVLLDYSATSQVPGYTALKSPPAGLFGGNAALGRERADQVSLGLTRSARDWTARVTVFHRRDDDLVDWTFSTGAPFARQANAVDIDVNGVELLLYRSWDRIDLAAGFTHLDKDADYGSAAVDASFYALNFARNRATLALTWRMLPGVEFRLDNEYRAQEDNPLRSGDDNVYLASVEIAWLPAAADGLRVRVAADNVTDSDYQTFPGTPGAGRQVSVSAAYGW